MSDRELAERFPHGDDEIVAAVYTRYGGAVYTVARSIVADATAASDVVQATFVNAWRAAGRFDPGRDLAPWLYTIARRQALDFLRRERRLSATDPHDLELLGGGDEPSLERTWEDFQVRVAVDALPSDERQVVRLAWFDELTHAQIAAQLGVPIGTVKSRSHRAQRHLATALAGLHQNRAPAGGVGTYED